MAIEEIIEKLNSIKDSIEYDTPPDDIYLELEKLIEELSCQ